MRVKDESEKASLKVNIKNLRSWNLVLSVSSLQSLSHVWLFATPWTATCQASLSITNSWSLLKNSCPLSRWCHPSVAPSPPTFSLSPNQGLFQWVNSLYQVAKYCRFSCSISPSNEYSVLISFRMTGWIFLQSKGLSRAFLKTTVQKYPFFSTQLSLQSSLHPYMTTGKTIVLTRWNFVGKVMSLFYNMLSSLVITFLPRSKHLSISWLQVPICSEFEAPKNKVSHCFHYFRIYLSWSWILKRHRNQQSNCQHPLNHRKSKRVSEKHLPLLYWLHQSLWLCAMKWWDQMPWSYVGFWDNFFTLLFHFHQEAL